MPHGSVAESIIAFRSVAMLSLSDNNSDRVLVPRTFLNTDILSSHYLTKSQISYNMMNLLSKNLINRNSISAHLRVVADSSLVALPKSATLMMAAMGFLML